MEEKGTLFIVSTPIGNLKDITFRAIETLKEVDFVVCEDTRHTRELLNHFDIKTKTISFNRHTDEKKADEIIEMLIKGQNIAYVSDAGTPIISDPGDILVKKAKDSFINVTAIPGACAAINALVLSGIECPRFTFFGFIPDDKNKRKAVLSEIANETKTMVFYVAPHDIKKLIKDLASVIEEDREMSYVREMTKLYEESKKGTLKSFIQYFETNAPRGEFVLVVKGKNQNLIFEENINKWKGISINEHMDIYLKEGLTEKEAMKKVAKDRDITKSEVYNFYKVKGEQNG